VTARAFTLGHELGHLRYHHTGSSIPNERQADAFAAQVMERTPLPMLGALVFFMADAHMADYPAPPNATHPMSAERLHALAARVSDRKIAAGIEMIAKSLEDPDVAATITAVGRTATPTTLGPRRPGALPTLSRRKLPTAAHSTARLSASSRRTAILAIPARLPRCYSATAARCGANTRLALA